VVLKRIKPEHAKDSRFIRMFLDEARVAANLHHQHVVQVHDIGENEGEYFIAMEYLHGEDVRTILSTASKMRQHVPLGAAMAIVSAAAAGLHYAHERRGADKRPLGIVHRDISPSNILVGYDGSIKVVDFGIAKASARQETRSSSLKGKISYMSPEQCKGAEVDRRSDVYSLGVVLYELCTTTRLFKGESDYLVMDQIVNGRVTLPQVRRPELPNELSAIIMRAIAPDPERRYFTADELRVALDHFAAKASLTTSTSAISTYMRKQFGEKPEPWLELEGQDFDSFEEVPQATHSGKPGKTWTELPQGDDFRRSTSSIPRQSGAIPVMPVTGASDTARSSVSQISQVHGTPATTPTDAKMGWESQQPPRPAPPPRAFSPAKIGMIAAPVVLLLGIAIWRFAGTGSSSSPVASAPPPPAPAAAPMVTPIPEPPAPTPAPPPAAVTSTPEPAPQVAKAEPSPSKRNASSSSSSSSPSKRQSPSKISESSSPAVVTKSEVPAAPPAPAPTAAAPLPTPAAIPVPVAPPPTTAPLPAPPPSPAPPVPPQTVAPTVLDANRIGGDRDILPDSNTQVELARSGVDTIAGSFKICLTTEGAINTVSVLKGTGFSAYDTKIQDTIRRTWRYRPFMVNGKPAQVCTAVRFVYQQK
jgi:serine/threonine-protein kinase